MSIKIGDKVKILVPLGGKRNREGIVTHIDGAYHDVEYVIDDEKDIKILVELYECEMEKIS